MLQLVLFLLVLSIIARVAYYEYYNPGVIAVVILQLMLFLLQQHFVWFQDCQSNKTVGSTHAQYTNVKDTDPAAVADS